MNEKEPNPDFEDYDPYRADWTAPNSLHGSRYSLDHNRQGTGYSTDNRSEASGYDNQNYEPDRTRYNRHYGDTSDSDDSDNQPNRQAVQSHNSLRRPTQPKEYYDSHNAGSYPTEIKRY